MLTSVGDHAIKVVAAGRTDAGVHAYQQVVHFESGADRAPQAWLLGSNTHLPGDISLRWVQAVDPSFNARRSATLRHYRYVMLNARARSGLLDDRAARIIATLDAEAMQRAAQALVGEHDFSAFRDADCQSKSPVRKVHAISVRRLDEFVVLDIAANAFLHHMVRNIAGTLIVIGQNKQPESWTGTLLKGRNRSLSGMTAEACGLYFVGPEYPPQFGLPAPPAPWFPGHFR